MKPPPGDKAWKILLVDDSPETMRLIAAELEGKGLEISRAENADEATRLLVGKNSRPDLVLLDVIMPGVDGRKLCRFIKSNEMFTGIKVVLCSTMDRQRLQKVAAECGADGYIHKEDILGRWVVEQLRQEERAQAADTESPDQR